MKVQGLFIFFLTIICAIKDLCAQEVPNLWPLPEWQFETQKDTTFAKDENEMIRWKSYFDQQKSDSVFVTFRWNGTKNLYFSGKRRLPLQGCATFYFPDQKILETNCWQDDQLNGWFERFNTDSVAIESGRFGNSAKQGFWKGRFDNGNPKYSGTYAEGLKDGKWNYFHPDSALAYYELWKEGALQTVSDFKISGNKELIGGKAKDGFGNVFKYHLNGLRKQRFNLLDGEPEGKFWEYDSLGRILRMKTFVNGELSGEMIEYFADSSLASKTIFENGFENGVYSAWQSDGNLAVSGWFKSGKEDSTWLEYGSNELPTAQYFFQNGKLEGRFMEYFEKQKPKKSAWFKAGIQDSISETWNEKGLKIAAYTFRNGEKNGPSKEWFANGKPKSEGDFKDDLEAGLWKIWFENGQKQSEGQFINGKPVGRWTTWFGNGKLASIGSYVNGEEEGNWQFYFPDGNLKSEEIWKNGNLFEFVKYLTPKGKKLNFGNLVSGSGQIKTYNLDGLLEGEGGMKNGLPSGNWKYFYPQGGIQAEGIMENGKRSKVWKFYHPNGKLAEESEYQFDRALGKSKIYDTDGKLLEEIDHRDPSGDN